MRQVPWIRSTLAAITALGAVAAAVVAGAGPVSAVANLTCDTIAAANGTGHFSGFSLVAPAGTIVSVRVTEPTGSVAATLYQGDALKASGSAPVTLSLVVPRSLESPVIAVTAQIGPDLGADEATFAWSCGSPASPIPDWVQQYGRATADEACRDGWGPSWAWWTNDHAGGWVCTRTIPSLG